MQQRSFIVAAGLAMTLALSACGGSEADPTQGFAGPLYPAATLLSDEQAEEFVPTPEPVDASPTPSIVTVKPTAFAGDNRQVGPPGNPVASTLADPPAEGLYQYRFTVQGDFGEQSNDFAIAVSEPRTVRGGTTQTHVWEIEGFPQTFDYRYTAQRLFLERVESTQPDGSTFECIFDPPHVEMQLPLSAGAGWNGTTSCEGEDQTAEFESEVVRTERVEVAGTAVDTFVVRTITVADDDSRTVQTVWFAPTVRMYVLFEQEIHSETFGSLRTTAEMLSLTPSG